VNGVALFSRELDAATQNEVRRTTYHGSVSDEKMLELREKALSAVIDGELQYQDAVERGMKPDRNAVKTQMEQIRKGFRSSKEYKQALEKAGLTEKAVRAQVEKSLLVQAVFVKTVTEPSQPSDKEIKAYYEGNAGEFKQPERLRIRILSSRDQTKAGAALEMLIDGEDFGDVAARMSEDKFRTGGGDIGFVHRGSILPELEEAAFKLEDGGTSGIIKADGQWFIIKVESRMPERIMSFDESRDGIKKDLEKKRSTELLKAWMSGLRAKAKIEYVPQAAGNGQAVEK
jgi:parvulin-like peptidyl-prolyl isomerase